MAPGSKPRLTPHDSTPHVPLLRRRSGGEDRYWEYVAAKVSLVHDVDDTRENDYGAYYTKKNPLRLEECKKIEPGI